LIGVRYRLTLSEAASPGLSRPQQALIDNYAVGPEDIQQNSSIFAKVNCRSQPFGCLFHSAEKLAGYGAASPS